jgi:hypothetical protein
VFVTGENMQAGRATPVRELPISIAAPIDDLFLAEQWGKRAQKAAGTAMRSF